MSWVILADFKPQHAEKKTKTLPIVVGVLGSFLIFLVSGVLCWRYYFKTKSRREKGLGVLVAEVNGLKNSCQKLIFYVISDRQTIPENRIFTCQSCVLSYRMFTSKRPCTCWTHWRPSTFSFNESIYNGSGDLLTAFLPLFFLQILRD